jgi:MFS family permease
VAVLEPYAGPALAPAAHERLVTRVALTTWLASALLAAGVFALLLAPRWLRRRDRRRSGFMLRAIVCVLLVTGAGLAWIHWWPDAVREDLRGDFSSLRYWWRHPFLAAGLTRL